MDIRDIPEAHIDRALDLCYLAFHEKTEDKTRKRHHELLLNCARVGAYDGQQLVGLTVGHPFQLSVPGGELPCAGLDFVAVAPTHRRRGALSGMLDGLWRRCAEAGQPLACLWASEAAIYGRFGFGPGTEAYTVEIDSSKPLALRIEPDERPLRLVPPQEAPGLIAPLYDASRARRGGRNARDLDWWRQEVLSEGGEDNDGVPRVAVLGDPGAAPDGYVIYGVQENGTVHVDELEARTPAVAAALWRYLASIDLSKKVRAWARPVDDPLQYFAADRDQVRVTGQYPALWIRLVDVRAALTARSWAAPADLVLEVSDAALPANAGRFRLTVTPGGATYEPTAEPADVALDVRELASVYLGATPLRHLVRAGLVTELTPGAVRALDTALETELAPFTGEDY